MDRPVTTAVLRLLCGQIESTVDLCQEDIRHCMPLFSAENLPQILLLVESLSSLAKKKWWQFKLISIVP